MGKYDNLMRRCFSLGCIAGWCAFTAAAAEVPRRVTSVVRADARTGRLVRSIMVQPRSITERNITQQVIAPRVVDSSNPVAAIPEPPRTAPADISEAVERIAAQHDLSPLLLHSVIKVESNYNPLAVSPKGALGLMQLIPSTARRFGVNNVFDPVQNIQGGARYLRFLLDMFHSNIPLALAAYNAGEAAVVQYGGVPPYVETQNYLVLVRRQLEEARRLDTLRPRAKVTAAAEVKPAGPNHIVEVAGPDGTVRYESR